MKHVSLLSLLVICLCYSQVNAQCNNTLVEQAAMQSGAEAVYMREFKVKFDGSERGNAVPVAKYPVFLSKDINYRFNVCNAKEYEGRVILQLYLKDQLVGSTYDTPSATDLQRFDFACSKAGTYEVVMSFDQGKPGCAAGILSLLPENKAEQAGEELDAIYALADNPIQIYDDEDERAEIEVSINNGSITRLEGVNYILHPLETGTAVLSIRVLNSNGTLREFKQKRFAVLSLDKPFATLSRSEGGKISAGKLLEPGRLELWFSPDVKCSYQVLSFTLSNTNDAISGITSNSARLTKAQREFINGLKPGSRLYIKNIQVKTTNQAVMDIDPLEFEIE